MKEIRHVGLVVSDINKALRFYRDLLGLKVLKDQNESGRYIDSIFGVKNAGVRTVKLSASDGSLIELLCFSSYPKKPAKKKIYEIGYSHVAFTVKDIDKEYKRLIKAGVKFHSLPQFSPDGYAKVAYCRDFERNPVELVQVL